MSPEAPLPGRLMQSGKQRRGNPERFRRWRNTRQEIYCWRPPTLRNSAADRRKQRRSRKESKLVASLV
eukprot:scaffold1078_cov226-Pinguiococcus_pyrenoidosus.AAC.1